VDQGRELVAGVGDGELSGNRLEQWAPVLDSTPKQACVGPDSSSLKIPPTSRLSGSL
jgi:hypothetical protein